MFCLDLRTGKATQREKDRLHKRWGGPRRSTSRKAGGNLVLPGKERCWHKLREEGAQEGSCKFSSRIVSNHDSRQGQLIGLQHTTVWYLITLWINEAIISRTVTHWLLFSEELLNLARGCFRHVLRNNTVNKHEGFIHKTFCLVGFYYPKHELKIKFFGLPKKGQLWQNC